MARDWVLWGLMTAFFVVIVLAGVLLVFCREPVPHAWPTPVAVAPFVTPTVTVSTPQTISPPFSPTVLPTAVSAPATPAVFPGTLGSGGLLR